ncbi:MAG: HD-GYP domain-containing protein [Pseudomonadota bacterium]
MTQENPYEKQVTPDELKPGMFVSRLDRPWIETPFLLQGFEIRGIADVEQVRRLCRYVFIDVERGNDITPARLDTRPLSKGATTLTQSQEELPRARKALERTSLELTGVLRQAARGRRVRLDRLESRIVSLVDSTLRSTDASLLLARLRRKDDYAYNHALCVSVFGVALGKQLGLERSELEQLALCASLFDIGKTRISDELLQKLEPITSEERQELQRHVDYGVEILKQSGADTSVISVASDHHERCDGTGYPKGLTEPDLSLFAQIVGLVDTYDAMMSDRGYRAANSHEKTVNTLYQERHKAFNAELLEQFIHCLGTYPVGSLVELSSGDVGIVIQQNGLRRLRPQVMLVRDADGQPIEHYPVVNLLTETTEETGEPVAITRTLECGAFGIDPTDYFLQ